MLAMGSVGPDLGQESRNQVCPAEIGTVGSYAPGTVCLFRYIMSGPSPLYRISFLLV